MLFNDIEIISAHSIFCCLLLLLLLLLSILINTVVIEVIKIELHVFLEARFIDSTNGHWKLV